MLPSSAASTSLQKSHFLYLSVAALATLIVLIFTITQTPLWFDELFTYYVARQPGPGAVMRALLEGADNHPPLDYLVRHYSLYLPGPTELTLRLPSVIAFVGFCSCIFVFVNRCAGPIAGVTAFLIPLATSAYKHAPEARPYPLVLLFTGLSMVAWQSSRRGASPAWGALLALSLAVTMNAHYYGVLLLAAFFAAEAFRWWYTGQLHKIAVIALTVSLPSLFVLLPFAREASKFSAGFWTPLTLNALPAAYGALLGGGTLLLIVVAGILAVSHSDKSEGPAMESDEDKSYVCSAVLAVCLISTMLACFVLALLVTKAFLYRYAIVTVAGVAAFLPLTVARHGATKASQLVLLAASLTLALLHAGYHLRPVNWHDGPYAAMGQKAAAAISFSPAPVFWGNLMECFALTHYFPELAANRIYCVAGPSDRSTLDRAANGLRPFTSLPIVDAAEMFEKTPVFSVVYPQKFGYAEQLSCDPVRREPTIGLPVSLCRARSHAARAQ